MALADGLHTLQVQERDAAGNWSADGQASVTVDTTPPVLLTVSAPATPTVYRPGDRVTLSLLFSEAVSCSGNALLLALNTGATVAVTPPYWGQAVTVDYTVRPEDAVAALTVTRLSTTGNIPLQDAAGNCMGGGTPWVVSAGGQEVTLDNTPVTTDTGDNGAERDLESFSLLVPAGWNLISLPLELDAAAAEAVLRHPQIRSLWGWDPRDGYVPVPALAASSGYFAYAAEAFTLVVQGRRPATPGVVLERGWNLVGPGTISRSPAGTRGVGTCWSWQPRHGFAMAEPAAWCEPGRAYWVYADADGTIIWP
ncbi:MAG: hypothetical protein IT440_16305 [Phycisphaeraceae bacterium]|nr:hypothetical protein [Phycisphaeraceae bacterium]